MVPDLYPYGCTLMVVVPLWPVFVLTSHNTNYGMDSTVTIQNQSEMNYKEKRKAVEIYYG